MSKTFIKRNDDSVTRKILSIIREENSVKLEKSLLKEEKESEDKNDKNEFVINSKTPHFGDIRNSQEETLVKTIGEEVELDDDALIYHKDKKDLVLTGKIGSLKLAFQFRFRDPSGDGCYIWMNGLQLTDTNYRTVGKVRDAFLVWKKNITMSGDLMSKLKKAAEESSKKE